MKKFLTVLLVILLSVSCLFAGETKERPSVALVLSGGGAKGIAHIAVLYTFEKLGIPIDKIFGTSMGSLIGGIYAAGYSPSDLINIIENDNLAEMFTTIESSGYHELNEPFQFYRKNIISINIGHGKVMGTNGILDDYEIMNFFERTIGNVPKNINFDRDLVVPFECNAADMVNGGERIFKSGDLIQALRSSMSIPVAFSPVITEDNEVYMDGGVVSNMIVHRAIEEGYDIIFAVSLPVDPGVETTAEDYKSFSGMLEGTLSIVLSNAMGDEAGYATYHLPINMKGFGTLSFGEGPAILQRGFDEVESHYDLFTAIASQFTEDQKEYKDPDRVGEYFTKYPQREQTQEESSYKRKQEKALQNSRFGIGFTGPFTMLIDPKQTLTNIGHTSFTVLPSLYTSIFLKEIGGTKFSIKSDVDFTINQSTVVRFMTYYEVCDIGSQDFYWTTEAEAELGRLTQRTSTFVLGALNKMEYRLGVSTGLNLTDELSTNLVLKGGSDFIFVYGNYKADDPVDNYSLRTGIRPYVELGGAFYSKMEGKIFEGGNARYDFLGNVGWLNGTPEYKIAAYIDQDIVIDDRRTLAIDTEAYTNSGSTNLLSSYECYGGWDGIPGYSDNYYVRDYVMAGLYYKRKLDSKSLVGKNLLLQVRGGFKSPTDFAHDYEDGTAKFGFNKVPFSELSWKNWDLGFAVGIGLDVQVLSDAIIGIGVNLKGQTCVYFELF